MSFTFGGGGSAPKTTGGGLSFPTATTSTAVGSTGFSFGSALTSQPSSATPFSFGTSTATITTSATGSLFSTTTTTSQQPVVASGGFLGTPASTSASTFSFSAPATTTASGGFTGFQLPTSTPAATVSPTLQFGGSSKPQGAALEPAKSAAPTLQASFFSTSKPAGTSLLTPTTTTTAVAAAAATTTTTTTATTAAPALGFPSLLLGQTLAPSTTTTTALGFTATTITTATSSLSTSTPSLASLTTATSTSSAAGVLTTSGGGGGGAAAAAAAAAAGLSVAGLEEKVNKWMSELREQEERLMRQAAHVNAWDQLLQQGHDQVQQLRLTLNNVKTDQNRLQAELDFIQGQQQELEQLIEPLEAAATSTRPAQHQGDRQRENMHLVAQNLDSQLRQITDDLCKVIEHLNSSNSGSRASDPVNTVARVLSAHMDTLKWVDQNSALLNQKIDELSRASDSKRRD